MLLNFVTKNWVVMRRKQCYRSIRNVDNKSLRYCRQVLEYKPVS